VQTITLRLRLHQPTKAKQAVYRELAVRVTGLANNLVAAGRPKKLTSKTAKPYCPDRITSVVSVYPSGRLTGRHSCSPDSVQPSSKAQLSCMRSVRAGTWLSPSPSR
jgi:hypothetical protein